MGLAAQQLYSGHGNTEILRKQFGDGLVGFAVGGWRGRSHQQVTVRYTCNLIVFRPRADAYREDQVITLDSRGTSEFLDHTGRSLYPAIMIRSADSKIIANNGDRSNPPIDGRRR